MPPLSTTAIATISGAIAFISIGAIGVFAIWRLRKRRALQQDTVLPLHHQRSLTRSLPHGHSHSYSQSNSQGHNHHHHHSSSHSYSNSQSQTQNHLAGQQHENPHQNDRPSTGSIKENQQQQPGTWEGLGFARLTAALSRSTGSVGSPKSQNSHQRAQPEVSPKSAWSPMSDTSPRPQRSSPWSPWSPKSVRSARSGWSIRSNWPLGSARSPRSPRSVKSVRGWPLRSPGPLGTQGRRERQQGERSRQLGNLNQQTTSQGQQQQQLPGGNRQEGQRETTTQRGRERSRGAPKTSARRKDESRPPTPPPKDRPTTTSLGTSPPRRSPPQGSTHTRLSLHLVAGPPKDYSLPKQTSASTGSPHTHIPSNSYLNPAGEPWVRVPPPAAALPPRPLRPPSRTATVPAPTLSLFPRNSSAATGGAVVPVMMGGRTGMDTRTITGMGTGIVPTTNPQHRRARSASQPRRARSQSVLVVKVPPLTSPKSTSHLYHAMISGGSRIGAAR